MNKPNIIFILSDQQRWDTLGCYGQSLNVTPNIDRMASEGVRFENTFTCQPVCGPVRSCLQTGKYAAETGCFRNGIALPLKEKTIAHWLSEADYEVGYIGKWHLATTTANDHLQDDNIQSQPQAETLENGTRIVDYRTSAIPPERRGGYKDHWTFLSP